MSKLLCLPMAALLLLPAAADIQVLEEILVKVNGEIITRSELDRSMKEVQAEFARQNLPGEELKAAMAERDKNLLRDLIDQSLLAQRGKELNVSVESQVIKQLDELRRQYNIASMEEFERWVVEKSGMAYEDMKDQIRNRLLTERVIGQEVGSKINVSKEDIAKYYEEHKKEFVRP